jgi:hypothetical protein
MSSALSLLDHPQIPGSPSVAAPAPSVSHLSLDDAVAFLAGRYATRAECKQAWRRLCSLVLDGSLHPRGRFPDGTTFVLDLDQFHDMAGRYFRYAACLRWFEPLPPSPPPPGAVGWGPKFRFVKIEGPGSYKLRDGRGIVYAGCNLIFPKAEVEAKAALAPPVPRAQPKRARVKELLLAMFPEGVPPKEDLPDWKLLAGCKGGAWGAYKDDTILRAAGRR